MRAEFDAPFSLTMTSNGMSFLESPSGVAFGKTKNHPDVEKPTSQE
jgi:hypothetical protein